MTPDNEPSGRTVSKQYEVLDPHPVAASAPYTYFLPDAELLKAIGAGDFVKAVFQAVPSGESCGAERMWVRITLAEPEWLEGILESRPVVITGLSQGSVIRLPRSHVIDVIMKEPTRAPTARQSRREYWERCLVDQQVLNGNLRVGYLYREAPDLTKEGIKFPDSGWRIKGDTRDSLMDETTPRKVAYVALGAVLNRDDSWLHLIDEPVGSCFEKDFEKGVFIRKA